MTSSENRARRGGGRPRRSGGSVPGRRRPRRGRGRGRPGRGAGRASRSGRGRRGLRSPRRPCRRRPGGGHGLEDDVGHALPERGKHQHVGRLEQARHVVAGAQPADPPAQGGPPGELPESQSRSGPSPARARCQPGHRAMTRSAASRRSGSPFWGSSRPTQRARWASAGMPIAAARDRLGRVEGRGIDAVGDDGQAARGPARRRPG